ncbi:Na(+)-translocating NADH-quinone reductase subunit F [Aequorivita sp. H23M31]|uniref:Na(+)-translocating NADH-quinone reductase subunit F n=1 Tax=Aequorivita ciconiae TaxID=2494375 RepID=A0A410G2T2_9FLAO|nr:Na(+)-translocating NADH-quinone reductase subunit F [Aequorivita sp. H23M31]QAA81588.1 Na(+)-translocating NADH-quinone reductase subunit F [Aequorivita sp. H23M31]
MVTSKRFDSSIEKLYKAFHSGKLNPECCNHCAVGNICDNTDTWKNLTEAHGSLKLNYVGLVNENFGRKIHGYKPSELLQIEAVFLRGCGYTLPYRSKSKRPLNRVSNDVLFNGLCAVVAFLCELEGIPDILNVERLFDFQPNSSSEIAETLELA